MTAPTTISKTVSARHAQPGSALRWAGHGFAHQTPIISPSAEAHARWGPEFRGGVWRYPGIEPRAGTHDIPSAAVGRWVGLHVSGRSQRRPWTQGEPSVCSSGKLSRSVLPRICSSARSGFQMGQQGHLRRPSPASRPKFSSRTPPRTFLPGSGPGADPEEAGWESPPWPWRLGTWHQTGIWSSSRTPRARPATRSTGRDSASLAGLTVTGPRQGTTPGTAWLGGRRVPRSNRVRRPPTVHQPRLSGRLVGRRKPLIR
jgi:hypothetical protein